MNINNKFIIFFFILVASLLLAQQYKTIYNPYTNKLDYVSGDNISVSTITFTNFINITTSPFTSTLFINPFCISFFTRNTRGAFNIYRAHFSTFPVMQNINFVLGQGNGNYGAYGDIFGAIVYAYRNVGGRRYYSLASKMEKQAPYTGQVMYINFSWSPVPNCDGYRIFFFDEYYVGSYYTHCFDTTSVSVNLGDDNFVENQLLITRLNKSSVIDFFIDDIDNTWYFNNKFSIDPQWAIINASETIILRSQKQSFSSLLKVGSEYDFSGISIETNQNFADIVFNANHTRFIRFEGRSDQARAGVPSFHIGYSNTFPTMAIGDNYVNIRGRLRIGSSYGNPANDLEVDGNIGLVGARFIGTTSNNDLSIRTNNVERIRIRNDGLIGINTTLPTAMVDISTNVIRFRGKRTISFSSATGNLGDMCWDDNYFYVCVTTNSWRRIPLQSW